MVKILQTDMKESAIDILVLMNKKVTDEKVQ